MFLNIQATSEDHSLSEGADVWMFFRINQDQCIF